MLIADLKKVIEEEEKKGYTHILVSFLTVDNAKDKALEEYNKVITTEEAEKMIKYASGLEFFDDNFERTFDNFEHTF